MSFMFKPLAYDDKKAINRIALPASVSEDYTTDSKAAAQRLVSGMKTGKACTLALDGYVSAQFGPLVSMMKDELSDACEIFRMEDYYKPEEEISRMTAENLPLNYETDPVLLFGRLYKGTIDDFVDSDRLHEALRKSAAAYKIICGLGSTADVLQDCIDQIGYLDVTPKICAIRAREGKYRNIGDQKARPFKMLMRRNYFVDFEITVKHRKELIEKDRIDYYLFNNADNDYQLMSRQSYRTVLDALVSYPFRAKPVYMEGIWGGEYIRKIRNIPMDIASNIAWIFEFIPMEVSIVVDISGRPADFPFSTFVQYAGRKMMGERCWEEFDGYFPVRFNYDDTWHSNGNMSVQCHPDEDYVIGNYDEFGRQDEAYYIIATGHGAKTYAGFKGDGREFLKLAEESEKTHQDIDYQKYINSVNSVPGMQIMIPAGTVHASGRNQFILELGSLTIGSYTYKVYDYNRKEKDGSYRPIHTKNAEQVLHFERNPEWVRKNIVIDPILVQETDAYREYIVGQTDLMYYETHRIELNTKASYKASNDGQFTVLTVVDGEHIRVRDADHPDKYFDADYLEIVTVPASIRNYVIENTGYQPCAVHKTVLKKNCTRYKDPKYNTR